MADDTTFKTVFVSRSVAFDGNELGQVLAEYENGLLTKRYIYGDYVDEPLMQLSSGDTRHYYHQDRQFSNLFEIFGVGIWVAGFLTPLAEGFMVDRKRIDYENLANQRN